MTFPDPFASTDALTAAKLNSVVNALYNLAGAADVRRAAMWHYTSNIITGNALTILATSRPFGFEAYQDTPALNDEWTNGCYLSAGTYELLVRYTEQADGGIVTVSVDDASQGTVDTYAASTAFAEQSFSSIVIATNKWVKVSGEVTGQNASSSGYKASLIGFAFRQAAD